ncbi:MAG: SpoIIE family protein phosphatase [Desulfobacterales bacterium]|jgi:sigma-B regulation protein RsbU (phosphoserine phosphatase)|nr:SpoIIE family protein phosphatase [Deltaproteobacteria bacterium]
MNAKTSGAPETLHVMFRTGGRSVGWWQLSANLIGAVTVTSYFVFFDQVFPAMRVSNTFVVVGIMFPFLAAIAFFFFNFWTKDLNRFLQLTAQNKQIEADLRKKAQCKILDMPFVSALVSFFNWFLAAITMTTYSIVADTGSAEPFAVELIEGLRVFIGCIIGGIITAAIIFFITEAKCRQIWPYFFPEGGLASTPGVFRFKLRIRMFVIFVLSSILPLILMAVLSYNKARMMLAMDPNQVIQSLLYLTAFLLIVTLAVAVILSRSFSTGIIEPIRQMEAAMERVEKGDLTATVIVNSNDELGALGENFNQMTEGLKDRYRLRQSLDLAKEVQQNLLPAVDPRFPGLDIAGKSIYCDETGGDYFDFFDSAEKNTQKFGVVIGDVSDHGIPSALLMASARAFLRQRTALSGSIADIVGDVNRQLTRDVEDTGRFITLFYLQIDMPKGRLSWVRAGHEPALLYDPVTDGFEELTGEGIALGVDSRWQYVTSQRDELGDGQIILLSTDGIWEARNPQDQMFGRKAVSEIIRRHAHATAAEIQDAILIELNRFQQGISPADDVTLVIVKVRGTNNSSLIADSS